VRASVIIVAHAGSLHLDDSLGSLVRYSDRTDVEVILVDNGSSDGSGDLAKRRFPWVRIVRSDANTGFAGGVHLGAAAATGEVLVLLNDDAAAEGDIVEAHLETLAAHPNAAASAGRLVSWDGERHDFVRGVVTFDCHAFQAGQGFPVAEIEAPTSGEAVPFACGGNMAICREDWVRCGGFDRELFAYFEDVDLGWRLWATGREVVACPDAVARHRGAATSAALGDFRRGVLFERNALRTFHACADDACRAAFGSAVFATFLHRLAAFASERPDLERAVSDPFGGGGDTASMTNRWVRRVRENGWVATARHLLARIALGPRAGSPSLEDGFLLMQLRAAKGFFEGLEGTDRRRVELQERRTVPDREILERFPRAVVPTYAGDEEWFASDAFASLLPDGWPLEFTTIDRIMRRRTVT
jgi:GT2 family glycosyltransferase